MARRLRQSIPTREEEQVRHVQYSRRLEDVEYWRQRAGWFNDDAAMRDFNDGAYESFYGGGGGGGKGGKGGLGGGKEAAIFKNAIKIASIIVALGLSILMFRAIMRRMSSEPSSSSKKEKKRSDSKSRSGSVKRSRSRSRSRKGDYDLMKDEDEKSRKSSRSKSSRRSRSRSRHDSKRSRSKGRSSSEKQTSSSVSEAAPKETVLV
ncbi:hypothetical protein ACA910_017732 [Epithemia clementina (nom. ined.)]